MIRKWVTGGFIYIVELMTTNVLTLQKQIGGSHYYLDWDVRLSLMHSWL